MIEDGVVPSPASEFIEAMEQVSDTQVQIQEVPYLSLFRLEIDPHSDAAARMEKVLGISFPEQPGEVVGDSTAQEILYGTRQVVACLWVHADTFLVVSHVDPVKLGRALNSALGDEPGLVLDVSFNRSVIELSGPEAAAVLARTVTFEATSPKVFLEGMGWRCNVGESELMLWRVAEFQYLMVPRNSHTVPTVISMFDAISDVQDEA